MKLVVKKEYDNCKDMKKYIDTNKLLDIDYHFAVIGLVTDRDGNVLLQRRGPKARDAYGMLADIGGAYEEDDISFRNALNREIKEEVGDKVDIEINHFVGGFIKKIFDPKTNSDINWLFLVYKCTYNGGELLFNEPGKCEAYEYYKTSELPLDEMLETTRFFWNYYLNKYNKCYSYAMGIGDKIKKIDKKKFNATFDDGDYEIVFDKSNCDLWEEYIINNMECNYWNDYIIDDKIRLIFKNDDGTIDKYELNNTNNDEVLIKCRLFAKTQFGSVRSMYENTPFYQDKLDGIIFYD